MKVFIGWSKDRSGAIAEALKEWIPNVIQAIEPWISKEDIAKGKRWSGELAAQLRETHFGIICVTPENQREPWLLFEAGALSKDVAQAHVCPFVYDFDPVEIKGPLEDFQATKADTETDVRKMMKDMNAALHALLPQQSLSEEKLKIAFDKWWPDLQSRLQAIPIPQSPAPPKRTMEEKVDDVLETVKELARRTPPESEYTVPEILRADRQKGIKDWQVAKVIKDWRKQLESKKDPNTLTALLDVVREKLEDDMKARRKGFLERQDERSGNSDETDESPDEK